MKLFILALCIVSAAAFTKRCKTADDCEENQCCVNYVIVSFLGGHCHDLRKEGESCTPLTKQNNENPDMHHFQCPCVGGLECKATHEIQIGEHIIKHRPECVVPEVTTDGNIDGGDGDGGDGDGIGEPEPEAE